MLTAGVSQPQMRHLQSELLLALIKTVKSECFATLNAIITGAGANLPLLIGVITMDNLKLYEISAKYIEYLTAFAPHLFHNKTATQSNERKYIGVILSVNGMDYFAPLSSFKEKHVRMQESVDFIKIKRYAVINLNNMFPVPVGLASYVDISKEQNPKYKSLLLAEYRAIKAMQEKIRKNALFVYKHKLENGNATALAKRCNDYLLLETACREYKPGK